MALTLFTSVLAADGSGEENGPGSGTWQVGVSEFKSDGLYPEHMRFTYEIPKNLISIVEQCPTHKLEFEELQGRQRQLKTEKLRELNQQLHQLLQNRAYAFIDQEKKDSGEDIREFEKKIEEKRQRISETEKAPLWEWTVAKEPECVTASENQEGDVIQPSKLPLKIWSREKNLDCIISGTLEPLGELIYIEVNAYIRATQEIRLLYRGTFFPNEGDRVVEELEKPLRSFLYGKEWSDIMLKVKPKTAEVYLDGSKAKIDETGTIRYVEPGLHSIEIRAPGYVSDQRTVETVDGSTVVVDADLQKADPQTWVITSDPSGAEVLLDSVYIGETPLVLKEQVAPGSILISKEGYSKRVFVMPKEQNRLNVPLHPESINIDAVVASSRKRFYQGLTAFLLSLPLTVVSYGQSNEYAYAFNSALENQSVSDDELERLRSRSTLWYTAYVGSMVLNTVFLSDTIMAMWQYIQSSQEY